MIGENRKKQVSVSKPSYGTRKLSFGIASGLLGFSFLLGSTNTAFAGGVFEANNAGGGGGTTVLYANGENPLKAGREEVSVADLIQIDVQFPKDRDGQNAYGTNNKKVIITYKFNPNGQVTWFGRPMYWFSLPRGVREPSDIKMTSHGRTQTFSTWGEWRTNSRWVAGRYQNLEQINLNSAGNPDKWEAHNETTGENKRDYLGSLNFQFNRMLDEQRGGWYDNNGGTIDFARSIRDGSRSIYVDWEPIGNAPVTITLETEVADPLAINNLKFGAGVFSVMGNIRRANLQSINTPHVITDAEIYELDLIDKIEVNDTNNIGETVKNQIKDGLWNKTENQAIRDKIKGGINGISVADNGTVTVTYNDGTKDIIDGNLLVKKRQGTEIDLDNGTTITNRNLHYNVRPIPVDDMNNISDTDKNTALTSFLNENLPRGRGSVTYDNGKFTIFEVKQGVSTKFIGATFEINQDGSIKLQKDSEVYTIPKTDLYYKRGTTPVTGFDATTAKNDAKREIENLPNLTADEKENYKNQVDSAADTADAIQNVLDQAIAKNNQNKKDLDKAKEKVKEEIDKLKYLTNDEKTNLKNEVDNATSIADVNTKLDEAKDSNLDKAKDKIKNDISNLDGLSDERKEEKKNEVGTATTVEQAEEILKQAQKEAAEKKAEESLEEANNLKQEYKDKIDAIEGLDPAKKEEYKNNIDNATNKAQMDSILQFAKSEAKRNIAKEAIDELEHLNNAQKTEFKDRIDNLFADVDINNALREAETLDTKMEALKNLVSIAEGNEVQTRKENAASDKKTAFETALNKAKEISPTESGNYADASVVEELTKNLQKAINDLPPGTPIVNIPVSKTALAKEIADADGIKARDLYNKATPDKKNAYDEKLQEAIRVNNNADATQDEVDEALRELQHARQNLDGTFNLAKVDDEPVIISTEANVGTLVTSPTDREKIQTKIDGIPENAVITYGPIKNASSDKVVTVTVAKDGVTKTIDIKVAKDETDPSITAIDNKTVTRGDDFEPIVIVATDNGSGIKTNGGITVSGLPTWLEFDEETKTIKPNTADNKVPNSANTGTVTINITATDNAGRTKTESFTITVGEQNSKYDVEAKAGINKKALDSEAGNAGDYIQKTNISPELPDGITYKWKNTDNSEVDNITLTEAGDEIEKTAVVIYPDGTKDEVVVKFKVVAGLPSDPSVEVKKNGDVIITPPDNADKIKVTYTPEGQNTPVEKEISKNGDTWNLPEEDGFKLVDGKIVLPDDKVKDGSDLSVIASSGNSETTDPVTITVENTQPTAPTSETYIKGEANLGSNLDEDSRNRIKDALTSENLNGGTAGVDENASIEAGDNGEKLVPVTITYDDGSKDIIKVKVIRDNTAPSLTLPTVPDMTKGGDFTDIIISANDAESGLRENNPIEVNNLPNWLIFDSTTNTIKLSDSANGKIPTNADTTINITIKVYDKVGNEVENTLTINLAEPSTNPDDNNQDTNDNKPSVIDGIKVPGEKVPVNDKGNLTNDEKSKIEEAIRKANPDLPADAIIEISDDGTVVIKDSNGNIITTIPADRVVIDGDAAKIEPNIPAKTNVGDATKLNEAEKEALKRAVEEANSDKFPNGTNVEIKGDGTAVITYPDGSQDTISGDKLVDNLKPARETIADKTNPTVPDKTKVKNPTNLTEDEKNEIMNKVLDENDFPSGTVVDVKGDGTAIIKYPDGSEDTIKGSDLVEKDTNNTSDAKENPAIKPDTKVEVDNPKHLTETEKDSVKDAIKDKNPNATDVDVSNDGTATIKYPDGSANTIDGKDVVKQKDGIPTPDSDATRHTPSVPDRKVDVVDDTKLTDEEKEAVKDAVKEKNPGAKDVEVSDDGTATIIYNDDSTNTISKDKTVKEKEDVPSKAETIVIDKPDTKVDVVNDTKLTDTEKEAVKEAIKDKNPGKLDNATIDVSNNGTVTIEFDDGSTKTIDKDDIIQKRPTNPADENNLTTADKTDIVAPSEHTNVKEVGKLTEEEKQAIIDKVKDANKGKLDNATIEVIGDGTVIITYPDGSVDSISGEKTVVISKNADDLAIHEISEFPLDRLKEESINIVKEKAEKEREQIENSNELNSIEKELGKKELEKRVNDTINAINNAKDNSNLIDTFDKGVVNIEKTDIDSKIRDQANTNGGSGSGSSRGGGNVLRVVSNTANTSSTSANPLDNIRKNILEQLEKAVQDKKASIEANKDLANSNKDILKIDLDARNLRFRNEINTATSESALNEILKRALTSIAEVAANLGNNTITVTNENNSALANNGRNVVAHKSRRNTNIPKTADNKDLFSPSIALGAGLMAMFALSKAKKREEE